MSGAAKRLKPLLDRVLVQRAARMETSIGGVVLPESAQKNLNQGTVVAVGPGPRDANGKHVPMSLKVGDTVYLSQYGGSEVDIEGEKYLLYREDDILGILKSK